uniref:Uncharacterized protein n=1 Tax=Arundo donax TaxID=35708 RepID=A0A0A9ED59_ARUDO
MELCSQCITNLPNNLSSLRGRNRHPCLRSIKGGAHALLIVVHGCLHNLRDNLVVRRVGGGDDGARAAPCAAGKGAGVARREAELPEELVLRPREAPHGVVSFWKAGGRPGSVRGEWIGKRRGGGWGAEKVGGTCRKEVE